MPLVEWAAAAAMCGCSLAQTGLVVRMDATTARGHGKPVGQVVIAETPAGVVFCPALSHLAPGRHGIQVREDPRCGAMGPGASPAPAARAHDGPAQRRGALPALQVDVNGRALLPVLSPGLTLAQLKGRALAIQADSDDPVDRGGATDAGARLACGVIPRSTSPHGAPS